MFTTCNILYRIYRNIINRSIYYFLLKLNYNIDLSIGIENKNMKNLENKIIVAFIGFFVSFNSYGKC